MLAPLSIDDVIDTAFADGNEWQQFVYPEPRGFFTDGHVYDPETGIPLIPHPEQLLVLDAFARRDENGFINNTWLYGAPKKSGKSTFCSGIVLWQAWRIPNGYVGIIANDLKQADSRMFRVIEYIIRHHPDMKRFARVNRYKIILDNGTIIEAVPVDPSGEAGSNPTNLSWTEAWGAKGNKAELMWTESALSPSRAGESFKLIESYAGHSGESLILERLYDAVVKPEFLLKEGNKDYHKHEIYANDKQGIIAYWCTRRIMAWQNEELDVNAKRYYANERATKTANEYARQHKNEWVSSEDVFVQPEWWNACKKADGAKPFIGASGVVIGIDAAVSNDCFAIVGVARDGDVVHELFTRVWSPAPGKEIDFLEVELAIIAYLKAYNVVCVTYDPYQMKYMADRIKALGLVWVKEFTQGIPRLKADKALQDRIRNKQIVHTGSQTLTDHVLNANAKIDDDATKLRIVKRNESKKVDACVALSMACAIATELNIG